MKTTLTTHNRNNIRYAITRRLDEAARAVEAGDMAALREAMDAARRFAAALIEDKEGVNT